MKKSDIALIVIGGIVILILVLSFFGIDLIGELTGKATFGVRGCSDSDGGQNPDVKGNVTFTYGASETKYEDYCYLGHRWLKEYYCSNNRVVMYKYKCENECNDGACI